MSTLPDRNELEFAEIEVIANSENDRPVFMLNLNKYFDRVGFSIKMKNIIITSKQYMQFCMKLVAKCYGDLPFMTKWLEIKK